MSRWSLLTVALLAAGTVPAAGAPNAGFPASPPGVGFRANPPDTTLYTVHAGDTLAALARAGLVGRDAVSRVARINHVAAPRRLRAGRILRIPRSLLRDESTSASVEDWSGPVTLTIAGQSLPLRNGVVIGEGTQIRTGRNGFITLRLRDGSAVSLPSQTEVAITRLRRIVLTGAVERAFTLGNGGLHTTVTHMIRPESSFHVVTPLTVSAVRGTDFRVDYAAATGTAVTEVDEGKVLVDARRDPRSPAASVLVPAGLGLAATVRGPGVPTALLSPPGLADPGHVQTGDQLAFHLLPMVGATAYHLQISRDAGALGVVAETTGAGPDFGFASIPAGTWFLWIAAIDPQGIEGTATSYVFDRYRNEVDGRMAQARVGRHRDYLFQWNGAADGSRAYRFRLWIDGHDRVPVVDEAALPASALTVRDLGPGDYRWQVVATLIADGRVIESRSPVRSFHIASRR